MRRSRFSEEQVIRILREQEVGEKMAEVCCRHGISDSTFYAWKAKYGGMDVSMMRRLKALEAENRRLKKLAADLMLDVDMLKEVAEKVVTPADRRLVAGHLREACGASERRACAAMGADRGTVR